MALDIVAPITFTGRYRGTREAWEREREESRAQSHRRVWTADVLGVLAEEAMRARKLCQVERARRGQKVAPRPSKVVRVGRRVVQVAWRLHL
jgi:hypothetical protein